MIYRVMVMTALLSSSESYGKLEKNNVSNIVNMV